MAKFIPPGTSRVLEYSSSNSASVHHDLGLPFDVIFLNNLERLSSKCHLYPSLLCQPSSTVPLNFLYITSLSKIIKLVGSYVGSRFTPLSRNLLCWSTANPNNHILPLSPFRIQTSWNSLFVHSGVSGTTHHTLTPLHLCD